MIIFIFFWTWQPYGRSKTNMRNIGGKTQGVLYQEVAADPKER